MKNLLYLLALMLFTTSCQTSHYNVAKLKSKYENKMSKDRYEKFKLEESNKEVIVKRAQMLTNIPMYFSTTEVLKPYSTLTMTTWDPMNWRVLVPPAGILTFWTKAHIYNQSLRQAAIACMEAGGDAVLFTNSPLTFQIIRFDDRSNLTKPETAQPVKEVKKKKNKVKDGFKNLKSIFKKKN